MADLKSDDAIGPGRLRNFCSVRQRLDMLDAPVAEIAR
jgi:hypothetical protein